GAGHRRGCGQGRRGEVAARRAGAAPAGEPASQGPPDEGRDPPRRREGRGRRQRPARRAHLERRDRATGRRGGPDHHPRGTEADMTQQREPEPEQGPVYAPEFTGGEWLQGGPVAVRGSGKVILVDFWDYTCVNCLRTLPYLTEWHRRYAEHGLVVVGVHTPEFSFAKNAEHVKRAIAHLALDYPVVLDA